MAIQYFCPSVLLVYSVVVAAEKEMKVNATLYRRMFNGGGYDIGYGVLVLL